MARVLQGKTALVTWAAGGIGQAIAWPYASMLKRFGRPEEVAGTDVFLASDAASLYIGQTLSPNGVGS
jgi:NAD(P)-dependent dehydrogenase (short-subunit alcohol dehydrogenase family)